MQTQKSHLGAGGGTQTTNFKSNFPINRPDRQDTVEQFRQAMADEGLETPDEIIPDGRLHRCRIEGDRAGKRDCWYVLHLDQPASGAFGHWRTGTRQTWCAKGRDRLTPGDWEVIQRRIEAARLDRQQEEEKRHRAAQAKAVRIWQSATPAHCWHPYLLRKGVLTHGLRVGCWIKKVCDDSGKWQELRIENSLLVPMQDFDGEMWGVQGIFPEKVVELGNRDKDFLSGARKAGLFHGLGAINPTGTMILAEGFATAATLFESLGETVLACFDAGNLMVVALEARRRFPKIDLTVACDNDRFTVGNPGLSKGRAAALASGARLLIPSFSDDVSGSDWNDWHLLKKEASHV
ncbi:MAG: toprim domain-containing protein [Magnetococcus sp. YQC-3]